MVVGRLERAPPSIGRYTPSGPWRVGSSGLIYVHLISCCVLKTRHRLDGFLIGSTAMVDISSLATPQAAADPVESVLADSHLGHVSAETETDNATGPPHSRRRYERRMGESELAYYLPSRQNGVNDMCVVSPNMRLDVPR